jgi:hypothetical protein
VPVRVRCEGSARVRQSSIASCSKPGMRGTVRNLTHFWIVYDARRFYRVWSAIIYASLRPGGITDQRRASCFVE